MDREKAQKILFEIIDGETSEIEKAEFLKHLETDKTLKAVYEFESAFRDFVAKTESSEKLPSAIRSNIMAELDTFDAESEGSSIQEFRSVRENVTDIKPTKQPFSIRYGVAMAASFLLMIVGGFATVSFFQHEAAFGAFEQAHYVVREQAGSLGADAFTADATTFIQKNFGIDLASDVSDLDLCGGKVVKFESNEFAHFKFCAQDERPVSLFVGSAADFEMPEMPSTIQAGKEYFRHSCHGCELMYWLEGDAVIIAASSKETMDSRPISSLVLEATGGDSSAEQKEVDDIVVH